MTINFLWKSAARNKQYCQTTWRDHYITWRGVRIAMHEHMNWHCETLWEWLIVLFSSRKDNWPNGNRIKIPHASNFWQLYMYPTHNKPARGSPLFSLLFSKGREIIATPICCNLHKEGIILVLRFYYIQTICFFID